MEIKINVCENFVGAIYALANAIESLSKANVEIVSDGGTRQDVTEEVATQEAPVAEKVVNEVAAQEAPVAEEPATTVWTTEEVRAKVKKLLSVDGGKYAVDVKGALTKCEANKLADLSGCNYPAFMDLLADLFIANGI